MFEVCELPELPEELRWRTVGIVEGCELLGWLAGAPVPIPVHWADAYKPCRFHLTKGAMRCPLCTTAVRQVFYVPVHTSPGIDKLVVIVSKTAGRPLKELAMHTALKFSKPGAGTSPTKITRADPNALSITTGQRVAKRAAIDIRPYLLHLWQDRQLTEWCGAKFIPSAATRTEKPSSSASSSAEDETPFTRGVFGTPPI